jgi:hypothetical protein
LAWSALRTYVGFSEIPELDYTDNGSYITDFFIDLNIPFTVENVINLAPIIKIYATQKLNQFQPDSIPPTTPPINLPPQRVGLAILKSGNTISITQTGSKYYTLLKNPSNTIIFESLDVEGQPSQAFYQQLIDQTIIDVYKALATNSNDEQYIVSFTFDPIDEYPQIPDPISKEGLTKFYTTMTNYLLGVNNFIGKIINNLIPKLQSSLPNVNNVPEGRNESDLEGPQTKLELYESFKSLNDKWISGNDFKNKTLFEDILLLDRASRNIGDEILVDIYKLKSDLTNINVKAGMLSYVQSLLIDNHFVVYNMPSYVNFYNVQNAVKNPKPRAEGSLDFANTMFGTYMNVDYRESTSKMVCVYAGKPSEIVDIKNNVDFRYRNDAFDLRRASDNPLIENLVGKNDWDKSNKVVGFNVDFGPQNQSIFSSFSVGQQAGLATAESLQVLNQMANQAGNRGGATQSVSLYNVYKNRSYTCSVNMMGNAMIQPTMYFNLRYVPMFNGPYMIMEVTHNITAGNFETSFSGVRQPVAGLPKIDGYLQSIRNNLLKSIVDKNKEKPKEGTKDAQGNVISQSNAIVASANSGKEFSQTNTCTPSNSYMDYISITPQITKYNHSTIRQQVINQVLAFTQDDGKLKYAIFVALYLESGTATGFEAFENNFAGITLDQNWANQSRFFNDNSEYFCLKSDTTTLPYAVFDDISNNISVLIERWYLRTGSITSIDASTLTKFWAINRRANTSEGQSAYNQLETQTATLSNLVAKAQKALDIWKSLDNVPTPTPTPSPTP